jgi:hypothetical protein
MVDISIIKNPIIIGILAAALTYLYIWWEEKKRKEKNPKAKSQPTNIITPLIVGVIAWFIASNYFVEKPVAKTLDATGGAHMALPQIIGNNKPVVVNNGMIESEGSLGSASYHIISKKDVKMPPIDVFIDLAKF